MNVGVSFLYTTLVCGSCSTSFTRVNETLTAIPGDIPADTDAIDLSHNQIASVDFIPHPLPALSTFNLSHNLLTEFPDFYNCSNVSVVILEGNALTHISADRLNILTRLTRLVLKCNLLQTIPDVPGPGNTLTELILSNNDFAELGTLQYLGQALQKLYASSNHIRHIPRELLEQVKHLTHLGVGTNQIQSFPDVEPIMANLNTLGLNQSPNIRGFPTGLFPRLPRIKKLSLTYTGMSTVPMDICLRGTMSMSITMELNGNPFHCDQEMRWLRLAEEAGVDVQDITCETPDSMAGRAWEIVTWEDLSYDAHGNCQQSDIRDVTKSFSCASHTVSVIIANSSPVKCATVCLARPDCIMFAMGRVGGDPSACAVTNGIRSDVDLRVEYERLYIVVHRQDSQ